ncbi:PrsW family intramembrane metalloprotease [Salinibaculum salinum]|uniref:PrsW family intramembrane metalloprotease n=1 Tax=Salinibaculum salinum TaxID=3131996 RepID=UPI0030EBDB25
MPDDEWGPESDQEETSLDADGPSESAVDGDQSHSEPESGGEIARTPEDGSGPGPNGQWDPIQQVLGGTTDLYDVATWEDRSRLDRFAVNLTGGLRKARKWSLISVAAFLFLAQSAVIALFVAEQPILGALGAISVVPALALAAYFWFEDPTRREPLEPMAITFLLSILFASFAAIVNTVMSPVFGIIPIVGLPLYFFLVVAPIEETVKWASIRIHAYKDDRFDAVIDGVVYGAIAGLGFAAIENFIYIINIYSAAAPAGAAAQLEGASQTAYVRAFVGPGHVIYSAFAGYYLGLAKFNPANRGPIVVKGLVIAVFIHALYNTLVSTLPLTTVTLAVFLLVYVGFWLGVLYRKVARYKQYYRQAQESEGTDQGAADAGEGW